MASRSAAERASYAMRCTGRRTRGVWAESALNGPGRSTTPRCAHRQFRSRLAALGAERERELCCARARDLDQPQVAQEPLARDGAVRGEQARLFRLRGGESGTS